MNDNDISSALSGLLADPAALSGIMKLASGLMAGGENAVHPNDKALAEPQKNADTTEIPLLPELFSATSGKESCALLTALRPFVSGSRRDSIDKIIKLLKLAEIAGGLLGAGGKE